jgi:REP element-mobilizing transposase RayT
MQSIDETNCPNSLPVRRQLHHVPPVGVSQYVEHAEYFITVCVDRAYYGIPLTAAGRRGPLANDAIASDILDAVEFRMTIGEWYPCVALVMPDHVHFIAAFACDAAIGKTVASWKRFLARKCGIVWQKGFFDHRLRSDEERAEKWRYIENNPVASGLCVAAEDWPFRRMWSRSGEVVSQ